MDFYISFNLDEEFNETIKSRFRDTFKKRPDVNSSNPDLKIEIHVNRNLCSISIDSSGDSLHKRGYKKYNSHAPLNEVLAAGIILMSGWDKKYDLLVPIFFIVVSILLISTIPTYSFKKIVIPRSTTKFLLFGIVLFFGSLLVYTFKVLAISSFVYLCLIPISYFHYKKIKKEKNITSDKDEGLEDIL